MPGINAINTQAIFFPVSYVILFALFFDLWEDFKRFRQDLQTNAKKINVIKNGKITEIKTKDVRVGDLLVVH